MNKQWVIRTISVLGALSLLTIAAPVFAQNKPEGPGVGKEPSQSSALTLSCSTGTKINHQPQYVCTVGNIDTSTNAKTTLVFRALTHDNFSDETSSTNSNSESTPDSGTNNTSNDDLGTTLNGLTGVTITPKASNTKFTSDTKTFILSGAIPAHTYAITVGQNSPDYTKEYADESSPQTLTPPVGQLPEVPYAVALPAVGVGFGLLLWRRNRRHLRFE